VDPDPQGQENEEISVEKCTLVIFEKILPLKIYKLALTNF
jgi:hypothetical protein